MPRALTEFEKIERMNAKVQERADASTEVTPAKDGATRKRRNGFNGTEVKISVREQIPGYHLHVFTDKGQRVKEAIDTGYEFVTPDEVGGVSENVVSRNGDLGERVRFLVNPKAEGSEQYGYLMKQRQEWYEEDQVALQSLNNAKDSAMRKGKVNGDTPGFYVPQGGISIK